MMRSTTKNSNDNYCNNNICNGQQSRPNTDCNIIPMVSRADQKQQRRRCKVEGCRRRQRQAIRQIFRQDGFHHGGEVHPDGNQRLRRKGRRMVLSAPTILQINMLRRRVLLLCGCSILVCHATMLPVQYLVLF